MSLFMCMSFGGSVMFLLYLLSKRIGKNKFCVRDRWIFLMVTASFFVIPYPEIKFLYQDYVLEELLGEKIYATINDWVMKEKSPFFYVEGTSGEILLWHDVRFIITFIIAIVGIIIIFGRQFYRHKKYLKNVLLEQTPHSLYKVGIRKVPMYFVEQVETPITVGFLRPTILLPDTELDEEEKEIIIRHELQHIKAGDMFFNIVDVLLVSIHWFNPIVYLWVREVKVLQELRCDEKVVANMDDEQRYSYSQLILFFVNKEEKNLLAASLSGGAKRVSERIEKIMDNKNKKKLSIAFAIVLCMSIFCSSLTVLAYNPARSISDTTGTLSPEELVVLYETGTFSEGESWGELYIDKIIIHGKNVFEGEDGTVYYYDAEENVTSKAVCAHNYINGRYNQHIINGDGCQLNIYEAQRCTECGDLKIGKKINAVVYEICPH